MSEYSVLKAIKSKTANGKNKISGELLNTKNNKKIRYYIWEENVKLLFPKLKIGSIIGNVKFGKPYRETEVLIGCDLLEEPKLGLSEERTLEIFNYFTEIDEENNKMEYIDVELTKELKIVIDLWIEYKDMMLISVAAKSHHHNWLGGLLQHILEVWLFSMDILDSEYCCNLGDINMPDYLASVMIHDFFKIDQYLYNFENGISIKMNQEWIDENWDHIKAGYKYAKKHLNENIANHVGSHHLQKSWDALFEPKTNSAMLLHLSDMCSAKFGMINLGMIK